jgi:lysozyme
MGSMQIPGTDSIIDLSHWNPVTSWSQITDSGVQAVILKASQGLVRDPSYGAFCLGARNYHLGRGSYHFGVASQDPILQANFFLTQASGSMVYALDWEWNKADTMTSAQASAFVVEIFKQTGKWPMIYMSAAFLATVPRLVPPSLLNCDLWLTGFSPTPIIPQQWATKGWKIWQHGLGTCPGISGQVDRDTFNGTPAELEAYFA